MIRRLKTLATLLVMGSATPGFAQTDTAAMAHTASANQLGILEYCQSQGDVGPDAVSAEKNVISHLPASSAPTSAAESLGKQGTLAAPNGTSMTLASMASAHNTTVSALCKQMGSSTTQAAAAYQQNGAAAGGMPSMPSMPSMSNMPKMPSYPGGMPSMGSVPSASGAAPPK